MALWLLSAPLSAAQKNPALPFWQRNAGALKRIREERAIIVAVSAKKLPRSHLQMSGSLDIDAPRALSFKVLSQLGDLPKISSYIQRANWDPHKKILFVVFAAFHYKTSMTIHVDLVPDTKSSDHRQSEIRFHVLKGGFKGLKGRVLLKDIGRRKTEMSLQAIYAYKRLTLPKFLVKFGLEVVLQKMASRVRAVIEQRKTAEMAS